MNAPHDYRKLWAVAPEIGVSGFQSTTYSNESRNIKNNYRPYGTRGLTGVFIGVKCPDAPITLIGDQNATVGIEGQGQGIRIMEVPHE